MDETSVCYEPIGVIRTDYSSLDDLPKQAADAEDAAGRVELRDEYATGVTDLDGFSHLILLYHLHQTTEPPSLLTKPFGEDIERGLFATRTPRRPNPIGFSVVRLDEATGTTLMIAGVDMLDETPVLDIKPFIPAIDAREECRIGWLEDT
jgi:tRNA-Thr(GGU) m(6)t(6)A37 methyltransferase TsaA